MYVRVPPYQIYGLGEVGVSVERLFCNEPYGFAVQHLHDVRSQDASLFLVAFWSDVLLHIRLSRSFTNRRLSGNPDGTLVTRFVTHVVFHEEEECACGA